MALPHPYDAIVGTVVCPPGRPATASEVWIDLLPHTDVALQDLLVVDGGNQLVLGTVVDMHLTEREGVSTTVATNGRGRERWAKMSILNSSDGRQRPPDGSRVRRALPDEVSNLLAAARLIPEQLRVPLGVIPVADGFAPLYGQLDRIIGPTATSMAISGTAGSLKSTAGILTLIGLQHALDKRIAIVAVNSKGNDFVFADCPRERWAERLDLPALRERDREIYKAMGFPEPPVLQQVTVFVPEVVDPLWRSARPLAFPRTESYRLSHESGLRYALAPTEDDERPATVVTRQCIEEIAGPFAKERGITTLPELAAAVEEEFAALASERSHWRNQFAGTSLAAALRQLRTTVRDIGPLLGEVGEHIAFPVEELAQGGTWVIDVASLPQRGAQAVLDEVINTLWRAKAQEIIPHTVPLVLLVDKLNRWNPLGPTASKLAAITRDQRHRCFGLIALAQQLSTLPPTMLANIDTVWLGTTRSQELIAECYMHLPQHIRTQLNRLPPGQRIIDAWPLPEPLRMEIAYPSWLISEEGLGVVKAWEERRGSDRDT